MAPSLATGLRLHPGDSRDPGWHLQPTAHELWPPSLWPPSLDLGPSHSSYRPHDRSCWRLGAPLAGAPLTGQRAGGGHASRGAAWCTHRGGHGPPADSQRPAAGPSFQQGCRQAQAAAPFPRDLGSHPSQRPCRGQADPQAPARCPPTRSSRDPQGQATGTLTPRPGPRRQASRWPRLRPPGLQHRIT